MASTYPAKNDSQSTLPPPYSKSPNSGVVESIRQSIGRVIAPDRASAELSRGREMDFASTGRGGAGNFVRSSSTSQTRVVKSDDSQQRGRELFDQSNKITHAGRGGAGNVRSPSRDTEADRAAFKRDSDIIIKHDLEAANNAFSSGRGGTGNIHSPTRDDRSRSRSRDPGLSTGRGGAGNIIHFEINGQRPSDLTRLDEEDRKEHAFHQAGQEVVYSHGRGGAGNIDDQPSHGDHSTHPAAPPRTSFSTGRGGAGNW